MRGALLYLFPSRPRVLGSPTSLPEARTFGAKFFWMSPTVRREAHADTGGFPDAASFIIALPRVQGIYRHGRQIEMCSGPPLTSVLCSLPFHTPWKQFRNTDGGC